MPAMHDRWLVAERSAWTASEPAVFNAAGVPALTDMQRVDLHHHRVEREERPEPRYEFTTPDGRPFLVTQREPMRARGPIRWRY